MRRVADRPAIGLRALPSLHVVPSGKTRLKLRATTSLAIGLAVLARPHLAAAFDYPEHAHISHHALALAALECGSGDRASCDRAREMGNALRAHVHGELFCPDERAWDDQPEGCFALGDIPALTGDHAASPLLTRWRWLDPNVPSHKQAGLRAALPSIVAMFNTSKRSPEAERLHAPDRPGFLGYIRGFSPRHWPLMDGPSDLTLEGVDGNYVGLAERGHPHFRPRLIAPTAYLASLRYLTHYVQYEPDRLRSKPDMNAFAWYADQHLGALRMAHASTLASPDDRELLLAVAMFLELNAWHYLEDSVAAGHMIADANSPRGALNNGALTATHNEYCSGIGIPGREEPRRVEVKVPAALCDLVKQHGWGPQVPQLLQACKGSALRHVIYGDHVILESGKVAGSLVVPSDGDTRTADAVLTENWAATLAAESLAEVVRASLGEGFGVLPSPDPLVTCGRDRTTDPAYTWGYPVGEVDFYECLYAWWEGDKENEHGREIGGAFDGPGLRALSLVPIPEPADDRARYPEETFYSGNSISIAAFGYGYVPSLSSTSGLESRAGATLNYLIAAPRTLLPIQIGVGALVESGFEAPRRPRAAADLMARYNYARFSRWYAGLSGDVGYVFQASKVSAGGDIIPVGVEWLDERTFMTTLELRAGGDGLLGWRTGLSASVLW